MNLHFAHANHFSKYFPNRQIIRLNLEKIHMLNAFIKIDVSQHIHVKNQEFYLIKYI